MATTVKGLGLPRTFFPSETFRPWAQPALSGATASFDLAAPAGERRAAFEFIDWVPIKWRLAGQDIVLVAIYLDDDVAPMAGINAKKLATLAEFLGTIQHPWVVAGDFNCHPKVLAATGWATAEWAAEAGVGSGVRQRRWQRQGRA